MNTSDLQEVLGDEEGMRAAAEEARQIFAVIKEQEDLRVPVQRAYEGWHTVAPPDYSTLHKLVKKYGFRSILSMLAHMTRIRSDELHDLAAVLEGRGLDARAADLQGYCSEWEKLGMNLENMRVPKLWSVPDMEWSDAKDYVLETIETYHLEPKTPFE